MMVPKNKQTCNFVCNMSLKNKRTCKSVCTSSMIINERQKSKLQMFDIDCAMMTFRQKVLRK